MKKRLIYTGLLFIAGIVFTGCYRDVIMPESTVDPDGPPQAVSYKNDVAPIMNTKCALAGCHVSGSRKPFLTTTISYQEIVSGGFVNTIIPKESMMYKKINAEMREYIPSAVDRQKVYDWIRNGAPNN